MKQTVVMGAIAIISAGFTRDISIAYIGIPLNLLVPCALGTYAAFNVGTPITPRHAMWGYAVACIIMGAAFTSVTNAAIQHFLNMTLLPGPQAGIAASVSYVTKFALPWLADAVAKGKWLTWIPFFKGRSDNDS